MGSATGNEVSGSAAHQVYAIAELRSKIIDQLETPELLSVLRVDKACMTDAAARLYEEVSFDIVYYGMKEDHARRQIYLDAVRTVNARGMTISDEMMEQLGPASTPPSHLRPEPYMAYQDGWEDKLFNLVVPTLRGNCRNLKHIRFGADYQYRVDQSWSITFPPRASPPHTGHIHHVAMYELELEDEPPSDFTLAPQPTAEGYTVEHWVDVWAYPHNGHMTQALADRWIKAIREGAFFGRVYGGVNFFDLPLTLDVLEGLYHRQDAAGSGRRLGDVRSENIVFDIREFQRFATVASSSLTYLHLTSCMEERYEADRTKMSFSDLPSLISIIRNDLRNLQTFVFAMSGIESAERFCRDLLTPDCLDDGGTIRRLTIHVTDVENYTHMYNILRCLSPILTAESDVDIRSYDPLRWTIARQNQFLHYLRSQPAERKAFLSVVDFSTLDIIDPSDVIGLTYHEDGRPHPSGYGKAEEWCQKIRTGMEATPAHMVALITGMSETAHAAARLRDQTGLVDRAELLKEAQGILLGIEDAREAAYRMARFAGLDAEREVRAYVRTLQALMEGH